MKGVQCYELFGGIAHKNHTFFSFSINTPPYESSRSLLKMLYVLGRISKENISSFNHDYIRIDTVQKNFNFVDFIVNALKINYQSTQLLNSAMEMAVI